MRNFACPGRLLQLANLLADSIKSTVYKQTHKATMLPSLQILPCYQPGNLETYEPTTMETWKSGYVGTYKLGKSMLRSMGAPKGAGGVYFEHRTY